VSYAEILHKSEARLDWTRTARELDRQVRAFNPWPVAETQLDGEPLRILAARPDDTAGDNGAGAVIGLRHDAIVVACGQGTLHITELQRAGRRPVSARDFANSRPIAGKRLG
jgi:methionyl-tRNA formyltransferase